jgi:hypothetical protein
MICRRRNLKRFSVLVFLAGLNGLWITYADRPIVYESQPNYCDPRIKPPLGDPNGYRMREGRCEGRYVQQVRGSGIITIVSFTESFDEKDGRTADFVLLEWNRHDYGATRLQALSLKPRTLYRMDTVQTENTTSFQWPTDVLSSVGLSVGEFGLIGKITHPAVRDAEPVYVPLRVGGTKGISSSKKYQLCLYSLAQLTEVFFTLTSAKPDGTTDRYIIGGDRSGSALKRGPYLAESKLQVPLPRLAHGLYIGNIGAYLTNGDQVSVRFRLYLP